MHLTLRFLFCQRTLLSWAGALGEEYVFYLRLRLVKNPLFLNTVHSGALLTLIKPFFFIAANGIHLGSTLMASLQDASWI